ncbi:sensor histidine kinase [Bacillaceae bacterium Marseille-Q3522]|nr:sensor histidine kinase [Bacillaceae bacterium Marseille-Q3522]
MLELLPLMIERVGILIIVAFLLSKMKSFRKIIHNEHGLKEKLIFIIIFGTFGIISNYTGVQIENGIISSQTWQANVEDDSAIANTRIMGVVIGGLLGGPLVGIGSGLMAGIHRISLGGFTAVSCGISTIFAGFITGYFGKFIRNKGTLMLSLTVVTGLLMECIQMGIIVAFSRPYGEAIHLVEVIAVPMIVINGFGTLVFMLIIQSILTEEERTRALETHKALYIAQQTLPYFRQGINPLSCRKVAEIILKWTSADAVSITNKKIVLAHIGAGSDHHIPMKNLTTRLSKKVIEQGRIIKATTRAEIQCEHENCPLQSAIVLPLKVHHQTVGTLKLYFTKERRLDQGEQELAEGLSKLFSSQLEIADIERQRKLLKDAEIKALQAQVHPHFLFNSINTISSLIRTDSEKARMLLLKLSTFIRNNLQGARFLLIPLSKEIEHVEAFLSLEQARFPDKYEVIMNIDPKLLSIQIPPFILQPLVENAFRHAFSGKKKGTVSICVFSKNQRLLMVTEDNGNGITKERLAFLGKQTVDSTEGNGTALWNIKKRIEELYGQEASFQITSLKDKGTKICITLPIQEKHWSEEIEKIESVYRR